MATIYSPMHTDGFVNWSSLVPEINAVMNMQWRQVLRNYVICMRGAIK